MTETDTFRAHVHEVSDGPDLVQVHLGQEMRHASPVEARELARQLKAAADAIDAPAKALKAAKAKAEATGQRT